MSKRAGEGGPPEAATPQMGVAGPPEPPPLPSPRKGATGKRPRLRSLGPIGGARASEDLSEPATAAVAAPASAQGVASPEPSAVAATPPALLERTLGADPAPDDAPRPASPFEEADPAPPGGARHALAPMDAEDEALARTLRRGRWRPLGWTAAAVGIGVIVLLFAWPGGAPEGDRAATSAAEAPAAPADHGAPRSSAAVASNDRVPDERAGEAPGAAALLPTRRGEAAAVPPPVAAETGAAAAVGEVAGAATVDEGAADAHAETQEAQVDAHAEAQEAQVDAAAASPVIAGAEDDEVMVAPESAAGAGVARAEVLSELAVPVDEAGALATRDAPADEEVARTAEGDEEGAEAPTSEGLEAAVAEPPEPVAGEQAADGGGALAAPRDVVMVRAEAETAAVEERPANPAPRRVNPSTPAEWFQEGRRLEARAPRDALYAYRRAARAGHRGARAAAERLETSMRR